MRREKLLRNPLDRVTRPRRKARLPRVPRWSEVEQVLAKGNDLRARAIVALMAYGGLRRSEIVALNVGDVDAEFGLRRVLGKGGHEASVPLPEVARVILSEYLPKIRTGACPTEPLFVVHYRSTGGGWRERRMSDHRVWKLIKALGRRAGIPDLHPHAFDIQTTTIYTRLTQHELQKVLSVFDRNGE